MRGAGCQGREPTPRPFPPVAAEPAASLLDLSLQVTPPNSTDPGMAVAALFFYEPRLLAATSQLRLNMAEG